MDIFPNANTAKLNSMRLDNGDENFDRRHFSLRLISLFLSPLIGSDKPFESVRSTKVLPYQGELQRVRMSTRGKGGNNKNIGIGA